MLKNKDLLVPTLCVGTPVWTLRVANVSKISDQLARIIEQVQVLFPRFEDVNHAMQQQSDHARPITATMNRLKEEMQATSVSLNESSHAIEQLNEAISILKDEVSRFTI